MISDRSAPTELATASRNVLHSVILIGGIGLITALCAYTLFGRSGVIWTFVAIVILLLISPRIAPEIILRMYGGRRVTAHAGGARLLQVVEDLARQAGLPNAPKLYIIPSPILNAFATGTQDDSVIAVTHGMLSTLDGRELTGVLAHEMGHIRHNDLWVMNLADTLSRYTHLMSMLGVVLFLFNLPLMFLGGAPISWFGILLLYFAPTASSLLQLGLSRAREYGADVEGARLTGDPDGLMSALGKIERYQGGAWENVFLPGRRVPVPSLLRTHPPTEERIRRLAELRRPSPQRQPVSPAGGADVTAHFPLARQRPTYHISGLWY
jgi:heat shock protein HtpX